MNNEFDQYLAVTKFFDFDDPAVQAYAERVVDGETDPKQQAIKLYNAVRDDIRYNPYVFKTEARSLSASYCLEAGESYCIPKAVLLGAMARFVGIPSRIGLADVTNHMSSPQLIEYLKSDIFVMHGFTELYLEGKWVKATPAFNAKLCSLMGVHPLEFDGENDSIFHEFGEDGERHMEYLADHGTFADVPFDFIVDSVNKAYPHLAVEAGSDKKVLGGSSLDEDMAEVQV